MYGAVSYFAVGKIFNGRNGKIHPLDCQEGSQVCCVGGDHDEGEEPPGCRDGPGGDCPGKKITALLDPASY